MKDPWSIVDAGVGRGEKRRVLKPVEGRRGSAVRACKLPVLQKIWQTNLERVFPPEERLGRFMDQGDTLDNSQCLDELGCDGLGLILFVLWSRDNEKRVKTQVLRTNSNN